MVGLEREKLLCLVFDAERDTREVVQDEEGGLGRLWESDPGRHSAFLTVCLPSLSFLPTTFDRLTHRRRQKSRC